MKFFNSNHPEVVKEPYATEEDFQKFFLNNLDGLYQFALLLTGDHEKAEECLVTGLEHSVKSNRVFRNWAAAWARRAVISKAVGLVRPLSTQPNVATVVPREVAPRMRAIYALSDFDRFVFVITVLERLQDADCASLLGCSRLEVRDARTRAMERIAEKGAAVSAEFGDTADVAPSGAQVVSPARTRREDDRERNTVTEWVVPGAIAGTAVSRSMRSR